VDEVEEDGTEDSAEGEARDVDDVAWHDFMKQHFGMPALVRCMLY
jgi:hypothetical protein